MSIKYTIDYIESIIDKQVGKGNQGTVFSLINDPDKVIKISHPRKMKDKQIIDTELNGTIIAGKILPQVSPKVHYHDIIQTDDKIRGVIVMDKIVGKTISSIDEYNKYKNTLAEKLVNLRKNGVIVNDIDYENIMIGTIANGKEDIYIIDYGDNEIAPFVENETEYRKTIINYLETEFKIHLNGYVKPTIVRQEKKKLTVQEQRKNAKKWAFNMKLDTFKKSITRKQERLPSRIKSVSLKKSRRNKSVKNVKSI
jgi:serine/threonine protein kinase